MHDYVEVVILRVGRPDRDGVLYSETALQCLADGKHKFYDEERRALMWKGSQLVLIDEIEKAKARITIRDAKARVVSDELFKRLTEKGL